MDWLLKPSLSDRLLLTHSMSFPATAGIQRIASVSELGTTKFRVIHLCSRIIKLAQGLTLKFIVPSSLTLAIVYAQAIENAKVQPIEISGMLTRSE
ncbi:hypothetical protein Trichorick_00072 [Candidatus Trichorickettsia mobilis]|uniref:Uncharacterized protein n=1 Tax=Candidatus Trichorickettsia mobilis TaxID=1346319 RepID=A0ABZ0UQ75_9RICK|nr:hypothetical protein Trichorick_00072 [Candidatus Trichorickettsia mobilis]